MDHYSDGARTVDFPVDARVELHPACDLWMRGARFGTVRGRTRNFVKVRMDHPQVRREVSVAPALLRIAA